MAVVGNQNVLRLEIPVVDSNGVTELNGVQKLKEDVLSESVISNKAAAFSDVAEEITFWAVLDYNECAVGAVQDAHQGNHVGMLAGLVVHSDLSSLEALLSGVQSMFGQGLDSVKFVGVDVDCLIDYAIGAHS